MLAAGVALAKFMAGGQDFAGKAATALTWLTCTASVVFLAFASMRYWAVVSDLRNDTFQADIVGPALVTGVVGAVLVAGLVLTWRLKPLLALPVELPDGRSTPLLQPSAAAAELPSR